jgi:dehydrogenase/reductase SDR family member 12
MITGANSGLGLSAAHSLAKLGATVHIVCRNAERSVADFCSRQAPSLTISSHTHTGGSAPGWKLWKSPATQMYAGCSKIQSELPFPHPFTLARQVHLHELNVANLKDVAAFAKRFADSGEAVHVLVNNAGCMLNERKVTPEGALGQLCRFQSATAVRLTCERCFQALRRALPQTRWGHFS